MMPYRELPDTIVAYVTDLGKRPKALKSSVEHTFIDVGLLITPDFNGVLQDVIDILASAERNDKVNI